MEIFIGIIIVIAIILFINNKDKSKDNRIQNKDVYLYEVLEYVSSFKPIEEVKYKNGYTEKSIENQLAKFLKKHYITVTQQHGVADKNARQIDIDIADGEVGIELKDAKNICKTAEFDRLTGQLLAYKTARYNKDNLVLAVCGNVDDKNESRIQDVIKLCDKLDVKYIYITV